MLSPHGVVSVRVPVPERYAIHKLIVSQLRATTSTKSAKDLRQAAILIEAVVEGSLAQSRMPWQRFPGVPESIFGAE